MINLEAPDDDQIPDPHTYIRQLAERIEKVVALHQPTPPVEALFDADETKGMGPVCSVDAMIWPCATVKILTGETP